MRTLWLVAALAAALHRPAIADERGSGAAALARARDHVAAVELDLARTALDEALRAGDSGPAELAEIYLLSGRVAAALGRPDEASEHFRRLLAIDPDAALPAGLAPKIVEPFEAARRSRGRLRVRAELRASRDPSLVVTVESDPLAMVAGARASMSGEQTVVVTGARRMILRLPPGSDDARIALAIVDRHGNRLAEARFAGGRGEGDSRVTATVSRPLDSAPVAQPSRRAAPLYARWYLWAGASGALLAGAVYFGVQANRTADRLDEWQGESGTHDASAALDLDARGRRQTILADVGFAAAAVTAGVAGWLFWRF